MAKQTINVGATANDRTGDPLRIAFTKINSNFTEVYNGLANTATDVSDLTDTSNILFSGNYQDLSNTPFIPSDISDLQDINDLLIVKPNIFLTATYVGSNTIISYTKPPNTDPAVEFDVISNSVRLTRTTGVGGGLYNIAVENAYDQAVSPALTLWNADGWSDLTDVKTRYYAPFRQVMENRVGENVVNAELIMLDTSENKYYKIKFSSWAQGPSHTGSFSYTRELIDTVDNVGIVFSDGSMLTKAPNTNVKFPQTYIGDYGDHTLVLSDSGRQIYAYNNILSIPSNVDQNFPIGSTIQIITGENHTTLRSKPNNNVGIPDAILYIQNNSTPVSSYVIPARSMGILTKVRNNTWQFSLGNVSGGTANTGDVTFSGVKVIGAGTASGDGFGYSTLELVPDNSLYGNNQYLVIDPTAPSHIHIRAGGPQDNSTADLILGGEKTYVRVRDNQGVRMQTETQQSTGFYSFNTSVGFSSAAWQGDGFGGYQIIVNDPTPDVFTAVWGLTTLSFVQIYDGTNYTTVTTTGSSSTPGGGPITFGVLEAPPSDPTAIVDLFIENNVLRTNSAELAGPDFTVNVYDDVRITGSDIVTIRNRSTTDPITIVTDYDGTEYIWSFNSNGTLNFPDGSTQTTAFTGVPADTDTLDSVTGRGAVTTNNITVGAVLTTDITNKVSPAVGGQVTGVRSWDGVGSNLYVWINASATPELVTLGNFGDITGWTVTVSDGNSATITATNPAGYFSISTDQALTGSGSGTLTFTSPNYAPETPLPVDINVSTNTWTFGVNGNLTLPGNINSINSIGIAAGDAVSITSNNTVSTKTWNFNEAGSIIFPDESTQTTAWAGGRVVSVPGSSIGVSGDKQGDIAFNGSYIYYCTQNFVEASYSTTIATTYSGTFPSIVKGSIPQPQAGWILVHNSNSYTLDSNATEGNPGEWTLSLSSSISVTAGDSVTIGPASVANIWKRVAWSNDTW